MIDDFNRLDNTAAKLLGLTISDDLTWNAHVNEVVKKASKKLYSLVQLKRSRLPPSDLVLLYLSCVRSTVDYAIPLFYHALPQYLKNELVRIEKKALSIILASMSYNNACEILGVTPIAEDHSLLCSYLFHVVLADPNHKLNSLLPHNDHAEYILGNNRPFILSRVNTNRTNNTFIFSMAPKCNASLHKS